MQSARSPGPEVQYRPSEAGSLSLRLPGLDRGPKAITWASLLSVHEGPVLYLRVLRTAPTSRAESLTNKLNKVKATDWTGSPPQCSIHRRRQNSSSTPNRSLGNGSIAASPPPPHALPSSGCARRSRAAASAAYPSAAASEGAGVAQADVHLVAVRGVRAAVPVLQHPRRAVPPVAPPRHRLLHPPHPRRAPRAAGAPRQLHARPRPRPPPRSLRLRPRRPARPRCRRVLHALRAPRLRLGRHLRRHAMGRHPRPRDLLPALLGGRRRRGGRPADRPQRHRDLRPPTLHPPRNPPRHRPQLLPRPRHPPHPPRHGLQQAQRLPLAHHGLPVLPHRPPHCPQPRQPRLLLPRHALHRQRRPPHRPLRRRIRHTRHPRDRHARARGFVGGSVPGDRDLREQVLGAEGEAGAGGGALHGAAEPAQPQDVPRGAGRAARPGGPVPGPVPPRGCRRGEHGVLGGRPRGAPLHRGRRHARPPPGAVRQRDAPVPGAGAEPHGGVLGRRPPGAQGGGRADGAAQGDHRAADVEQRAGEHQADRGRRVPRHRVLGVVLLPGLRPRRMGRQRQPVRQAGEGARGHASVQRPGRHRRVVVRTLQDVAARVRLRHPARADGGRGHAGAGRRGGAVVGAVGRRGAGRQAVAEGRRRRRDALVREQGRQREEAVCQCHRSPQRLEAPHGGPRHPRRAHPAAVVPAAPWHVQPFAVADWSLQLLAGCCCCCIMGRNLS